MQVVLAEDEPIIRMDLRYLLEELGYSVVADCRNGKDAIKNTRKYKPDIVLMDIKMPDMDGLTATRVISSEKLSAVVLLTSYSDNNTINKAMNSGALNYLVKPIVKEKLGPALKISYKRFQEMKKLHQEVESLSDKISEREILSKLKLQLQQKLGCSEEEAYRTIRQVSMEKQKSMVVAANELLQNIK